MARPSSFETVLSAYGEYHRDRRNIATHLVGVPLIVLAVEVLLSRPVWVMPWFTVTPAVAVTVLAAFYYLRLDRPLGGALSLALILMARLGLEIAQLSTAIWLGTGAGLFVIGWAIQFVGHYYEGRKPAFFDDLRGLIIAPIFIAAEVAVLLGLREDLRPAMRGEGG